VAVFRGNQRWHKLIQMICGASCWRPMRREPARLGPAVSGELGIQQENSCSAITDRAHRAASAVASWSGETGHRGSQGEASCNTVHLSSISLYSVAEKPATYAQILLKFQNNRTPPPLTPDGPGRTSSRLPSCGGHSLPPLDSANAVRILK
jgi:hypothetical protein